VQEDQKAKVRREGKISPTSVARTAAYQSENS
jgi:hypothetical protein